jgi:hypothetical protein
MKFAKVDLAASGDLVTAVAGKRIRVLSYKLVAAGSVTVKFQSGASTDLTGAMSQIVGVPNACDHAPPVHGVPTGYFETEVGEKLNLVLGGSVQVSGHLTYVEVL